MKKTLNYLFISLLFCLSFQIIYIICIYKYYNINIIYFWISLIIITIILCYQIFKIKDSTEEYLILFEIILFSVIINLLYVGTHIGLYGHDPHWDFSVAENILKYGWPLPTNLSERTIQLSEWPLLHMFTVEASVLIKTNLMIVAKYLPVFINIVTIIFFYLISKKSYKNIRVALLATLLFSVLYWHTYYHTKYIRETLAFMELFAIIYIMMCSKSLKLQIILIIFIISIAFSHHLTALILIIFLLVILLCKYMLSYLKQISIFKKYSEYQSNLLFETAVNTIILIFTSIIAYWLYIGDFTFNFLKIAWEDILYGLYGTYSIQHYATAGSLRTMSGFYVNLLFIVIFSVVLLVKIIKDKNENNTFDIIFLFGLR